ncbi:MAG: hypothetical protein HZB68_02480 [Candidatus Aenigmarchaeota archaeon]|nr:hypothetical protein [Candidatus Aenigmarchaeota archaeon]
MGWFEELNEDLVDLVLKGKKPGADVNPRVYETVEKKWGLENIISKSPFYYTYNDGERALVGYCISIKGRKVSDAVTPMDMAFYADLDDANGTYFEFEDCSIEPCCIRYYAETRWMDKPEHDLDMRKNEKSLGKMPRNSHILCRECEERDEYVTEFMQTGSVKLL